MPRTHYNYNLTIFNDAYNKALDEWIHFYLCRTNKREIALLKKKQISG